MVQQKEMEIVQLRSELSAEKGLRIEALTKFEESQRNLKEQIERFEAMETKLGETFKALSLDALKENSGEFLKLAKTTLEAQTAEGRKDLEGKKELIDLNIEAIGKSLSEVQRRIEDVGKTSGEKFTEVATLIKKHEEVTSKLKDTTEHLSQALASSKKRGEWGERMAEDIMRLAGMIEGINYTRQTTLEGSSGRPDYTFLLPNNLRINMDVKFPLDNYLRYLDAGSDHEKRRFKEELLRNTKVMIRQVTGREYINPADNTVDYVIVFIPNEQVYSFINEVEPTIMDEALKQKVILCSPFTLYAVLAVIRQAIENFNLERTASEILKLLVEFSKQWSLYKERFKVMGDRLDAARKEYDTLTTTRSNMLERPLKKIEELSRQKDINLDAATSGDEPRLSD
ncbi:MAG: DNA recombination protein RmuC [Syntrophorhabdus sp. PtaU1.Bin002]|nr:MAG: DNA recombination protein RmuC [Syntrophorhabdus sp. PtaB.Bin006]OPY70453.1 MAG: DNA recombination protein RmuC [Syntrophorhabdus sp. PtaU1.Bin002]